MMNFESVSSEPSDTPQNISVRATSPTSVVIEWDLPPADKINGIITRYWIRVTNLHSQDQNDIYHHSTTYILNGLHPYYMYKVSVAAETTALGPYSTPLTFQMPEASKLHAYVGCKCELKYINIILLSQVLGHL